MICKRGGERFYEAIESPLSQAKRGTADETDHGHVVRFLPLQSV